MNTMTMMLKKGMVGTMVLGMLMMISSAAFAYRPAPTKVVTTTTTTTTTTTKQAARPVVNHHPQRHHAHRSNQANRRPSVKTVVVQPTRKVVVTKTVKRAPAPAPARGSTVRRTVAHR